MSTADSSSPKPDSGGSAVSREDWYVPVPTIRTVGVERPWVWVSKGWADFAKAKAFGVFFGGFYMFAGLLVVFVLSQIDAHFMIFPLTAGFLMIGPIAAIGLYDISRRLEFGEPLQQGAVLTAFGRNGRQIAMLGLALVVLMILWLKIAGLIFALFFGLQTPNPQELFDLLLTSPNTIPFLIVGNLVGALLAGFAFSISVVSIPFLLHKDADFMTAIITSVKACTTNPLTMLVWGLTIVGMMALSVVTAFLALIVVLPVIGHASWHAYRDVVDVD